jgi:ankyrin repeat protein
MSAFRWLTSEARSFSLRSDQFSDYQSLDSSAHFDRGEDSHDAENDFLPLTEEERVQMVIHFHAMITHSHTSASDVIKVLDNYAFLANDEQYLDERKLDQSRVRGVSPLRNALLYKNYDIAVVLVDMGANVNVLVDHAGSQMTVLSYACAVGQLDLVIAILERNKRDLGVGGKTVKYGQLPNSNNNNSQNHNHDSSGQVNPPGAAKRQQQQAALAAVGGSGIDVNEKDGNGNFALFWACLFGRPAVAKLLVNNAKKKGSSSGSTPPAIPPTSAGAASSSSSSSSSSQQLSERALFVPVSASSSASPLMMEHQQDALRRGLTLTPALDSSVYGSGSGSGSDTRHIIDVHASNKFGWNALTCCCYSGHYELAMDLIALGVDHSHTDALGRTPLYICCERGHADLALALIVLGADLAVRSTGGAGRGSDLGNMDSRGVSEEVQGDDLGLLDVAITNGHSSIALLLIERGCDVQEASKSSGMTPLYLAARCGLVEVAEKIISQVAPSSHPSPHRATGTRGSFGSGRGSFGSSKDDNHYASAAGASATTSAESQLLLAMVRRREFSGNTALHAAVASSSVSMVALLLASGADIMARGASYETCLHAACGRDVEPGPMVSFVLEAVSNHVRSDSTPSSSSSTSSSLQDLQREMTGLRDYVALENDSGQTALHVAALNEQGGDAVDLLVQALEAAGAYAADILNGVDSDGNTALHVACRDLVPGPALALVEKGCDVGALDGNGRTAFQALLATVSESSSISSSCGDGSGNINLQQQQRGASSIQRGVDLRTMVVGSQLYVFCSVFFFLFLFVRDVSSLSFDLLLSVCIL